MSRSGLPSTIFLQFTQLVGSDAIHYVDGRHSANTALENIIEHAREIHNHRPTVTLVGYMVPGDHSGKVREFPSWVIESASR